MNISIINFYAYCKESSQMLNAFLSQIRKSQLINLLLTKIGGPNSSIGKYIISKMYQHYELHPTNEMMISRDFFTHNDERINAICNELADEKSRNVFKSMIHFRMYMDYTKHPGMELPQYFDSNIISCNENEVFVDVGGYDGLTSVDFINYTHGKFKSIVIFEPDVNCIDMIKSNSVLQDYCDSTIIIPKGAWSKETTLQFAQSSDSASKIIDTDVNINGKATSNNVEVVSVPVTAIDNTPECAGATFIKMDIEGAEWEALHGAKETITCNKPKLAICIYHSDDDMLRLIEYVLALVPEYKVYIRHHSTGVIETVAYFVYEQSK